MPTPHSPFRTLLVFIGLCVSYCTYAQPCQLSAPQNLTTSDVTACSVKISWNQISTAKKYRVKYQKAGTSGWIAASVKDTFFTFSGLQSNIKYTLSVQGVCQTGGLGAATKTKVITAMCAIPLSVEKVSLTNSEEKITVTTSCPFDTLYCNYGTQRDTLNNSVLSTTNEITLSSLLTGVTYFFKVSTCPLSQNNFTATDSFIVDATRPNIILIVLDDARYDEYSCNGAPSFMQSPNIDRIANEGINFKNSFVVHSECAPGRATIATGDYTIRHGVYDNIHPFLLNPALPLLPDILHSNGYYTALVGKNHAIYSYNKGYFNYWFEYTGSTELGVNQFNYQGTDETVYGYDADVMSDSALHVIETAPQPYFIQLAYHTPHDPLFPAPEYDHTYDGDTVRLGADTAKYSINYPSFIYKLSDGALSSAAEAEKNWRETLEMLLSVDDGIGAIFNKLDSLNQLENTMIIFTSDNGHMLGEHFLDAKRFAYEPSLRVPLFIRYPKWFPAGSIDTSNLALNIDYTPTILDAAGIGDTFGMDGTSLKQFYDGLGSRTSMYYHYWYSTEGTWKSLPTIHAVRDQHYIYINYGCRSDTTEEFFDLVNDPHEMINLVNYSSYDSLISTYRDALKTYKQQHGDTTAEKKLNCRLANPVYNKEEVEFIGTLNLSVFPNPAGQFFNVVNFNDHDVRLTVTNELGEEVKQLTLEGATTAQIQLPSSGFYFIVGNDGEKTAVVKLISR